MNDSNDLNYNQSKFQKPSSITTVIITLIIFLFLIVLFSGSAMNIINFITDSIQSVFNILLVLLLVGIGGWFVFKSSFNLLQKEPMTFQQCFPAVIQYFKDIHEVNFVPKPFEWEGARLDPTLSTYVIVMHFDFLEIVSSEHKLFHHDIILRWDAIKNTPTQQATPLSMEITKDINGFPLEQGKLTQEGFEKARVRQITTE